MTVTGQYSWSQTFRGKPALLGGLYGHLRTLLVEPRRTIPLRFIADGDFVVVEAKGDMVTKAGVRYDNDYCLIYRLADGKIVEIREYQDSRRFASACLENFRPRRRRRPVEAAIPPANRKEAIMGASGNKKIVQHIFDEMANGDSAPLLESLADDFASW